MAEECKLEFVECEACASKPGSPTLCKSCRANRDAITDLKVELSQKGDLPFGVRGSFVERWECNVCELPCRIEITTTDEKLPKHLKGRDRFVSQGCVCKEDRAIWERLPNMANVKAETRVEIYAKTKED